VLFVIRTTRNPIRSRPAAALALSVGCALAVGVALPYLPLGALAGFVTPPPPFVVFVTVVTAAYLTMAELVKRRLVPRLLG
jgi:Mg2+-importing ATPase